MLVGVLAISSGIGLQKFQRLESIDVDTIAERQEIATRSRAAYLQGWNVNGIADIFLQSPIRYLYLFLTPFLWAIRTASDLIGAIDSTGYLLLFIFTCWRLRRQVFPNFTVALLIFVVISPIAFAFGG